MPESQALPPLVLIVLLLLAAGAAYAAYDKGAFKE